MNDTVFVTNLCILGRHGVFEEERTLGQRFFLDIEVTIDARPASEHDNYKKAICYGSLCKLAQEVSDAGPYRLIETFAERVIEAILARFKTVKAAQVTIRKPGAPIDANFDTVGVTLARPRMQEVGFSLGSNVGEKSSQIRAALAFLEAVPGLELLRISSFYKTAPWGKEDQDWFVNACAVGRTSLTPHEVLRAVKEIEVQLGRTPGERWGPRLIDIDLLYLGEEEVQSVALHLPHPEMLNRGFVTIPLAEIDGDRVISGQPVKDAARRFEGGADDVTVYEVG
ncbi:MAG: 2-amino-4-hydroxy-6-hydroxymethyldihydropteridine diphosphokinase [Paracoccaceae bacterium]